VIGSGAARVNASRRGGISYHAEFDERSVTQKMVEKTACKRFLRLSTGLANHRIPRSTICGEVRRSWTHNRGRRGGG